MSADGLPDRVRVIKHTASLRAGDVLWRDPRDAEFLVGPNWIFVRIVDVVRGWGFFFEEAHD